MRLANIFDPTTGELRSSSLDDIAAWFIDTDYDCDLPLQAAQDDLESRDRRGSLGDPLFARQPAIRQTRVRPHRRQSHQPLRDQVLKVYAVL
jgi:hypothetical protein